MENSILLKKVLFVISLLIVLMQGIKTQQLPLFAQYMENGFAYNPAIAGAEGYTKFNITGRQQWLGFDSNAPSTYSFGAQSRLLKQKYKIINPFSLFSKKNTHNSRFNSKLFRNKTNGKVGIGCHIYNDNNGLINKTGMELAYSYFVQMGNNQVSFGLAMSGFQYRINQAKMVLPENNSSDPILNGKMNRFLPDASVGAYLLNRNYFVGISANQMLLSLLKYDEKIKGSPAFRRHYYVSGGIFLYPSQEFEIKPSVLIKTTEQLNIQSDISLTATYQQQIWGGFSYRSSVTNIYKNEYENDTYDKHHNDLVFLIGVYINQVFVGYAFDYSLSEIGNVSYGSHELSLSYNIGTKDRKYRWKDRY